MSSTRPTETFRIVDLSESDGRALAKFFETVADNRWFHPYKLTRTMAMSIAKGSESTKDVNLIAVEGKSEIVVAYGILRGWDEGYDVPSLGIIVHPDRRGLGIGHAMMVALRDRAKRKRATKIRLRVSPENVDAVRLYDRCGYKSTGNVEADMVVYEIDLRTH